MKQLKWLFYTGLLLVFIGCAKNIDVFIPYETTAPVTGDINTFFNIVETDAYETPWENSTSDILVTPKGTRFWIEANSFQSPDGTPITGTVMVRIKEIFTKGDMIKNQTPTIANGRLLNSAGEFHISVTQDGQELSLLPDMSIKIQIPHANPIQEMELFYGEEVESIGINWIEADENPETWENVQISEWSDSLGFGFGYEMDVTQLSWINCDAFVNTPAGLTETCIELPDIYTNTNTVVYLVFSSINGIMPLIGRPETKQFCQSNLPEGDEVTYIVVSHQGNDVEGQPLLHFAEVSTTLSSSIIEIIPVEASITEITTALDNL